MRAGWPTAVVAKAKLATAVAGCVAAGVAGGAVALRHVAPVSERVVPATRHEPTHPAENPTHVSGAVPVNSPTTTPAPRRSPRPTPRLSSTPTSPASAAASGAAVPTTASTPALDASCHTAHENCGKRVYGGGRSKSERHGHSEH